MSLLWLGLQKNLSLFLPLSVLQNVSFINGVLDCGSNSTKENYTRFDTQTWLTQLKTLLSIPKTDIFLWIDPCRPEQRQSNYISQHPTILLMNYWPLSLPEVEIKQMTTWFPKRSTILIFDLNLNVLCVGFEPTTSSNTLSIMKTRMPLAHSESCDEAHTSSRHTPRELLLFVLVHMRQPLVWPLPSDKMTMFLCLFLHSTRFLSLFLLESCHLCLCFVRPQVFATDRGAVILFPAAVHKCQCVLHTGSNSQPSCCEAAVLTAATVHPAGHVFSPNRTL